MLIFAFFMLSDPKTVPASLAGCLLYGTWVALLGWTLHYLFSTPNAFLYALILYFASDPVDQLVSARQDLCLAQHGESPMNMKPIHMKPIHWLLLCLLTVPNLASAFCSFYVAKADTKLFNRVSQVVMVCDGDKNVVTMASDFQGDVDEFAMVVPVPRVVQKGQIHVMEKAILEHLDAYFAPRLVEYFDENPCLVHRRLKFDMMAAAPTAEKSALARRCAQSLGVTIEAEHQVGEYDILILSARESGGLVTWLTENGYRLPPGAKPVIGSYLKQGMKFSVAKINLESYRKGKYSYLRPLQIAYAHRKFMLPIRLGTVNAAVPQELFIYALTRKGRVETTNYRTVKLPTDIELPVYIKKEDRFADFYRDMFRTQVARQRGHAVFLEYAWDMKVTGNRENFQGRYIIRHPWQSDADCEAARCYLNEMLPRRLDEEAKNLAHLTGWDIGDIRTRIKQQRPVTDTGSDGDNEPRWSDIWGG